MLCDVVVTKIKEPLSVLCDITLHIPELNNKNLFLGNNAFIKGAMGSLIHMIVTKSKNKDIRWCTKKYYSDESKNSKYKQLQKFILNDYRLSTIFHNWCSNTRSKIKAGIWTDDSDYVSTKIYHAHQEYLQNLGYTIKSD